MDLISRHGLTIDPVKEVVRFGNKHFMMKRAALYWKKACQIDRLLSELQTLQRGWLEQNTIQPQEESSNRRWWMDYSSV